MDLKKILEIVTDKNRIPNICFMILGVFLLALNYNLFFAPNNLVTGGTSGLAIVFNQLWGWNNQVFIYISSFILLIISFIVLGVKKTKPAIVGSILYPLMLTFTLPLSNVLATHIAFEDYITTIICTSILSGFANGLIYKTGYNTGGSDIIMNIMVKYLHMPEGRATFICNLVIIIFAGFILGLNQIIYAIIIIYISSIIVDRMIIGISKSKLFIIETSKIKEIEDVIIDNLHLGVTILKAKGGYTNETKELLMCAVPTNDYYMFKEIILAIDENAFFIINDCYDLEGGTMKNRNFSLDSIL